MAKNKLSIAKVILVLIILLSFGTVLGVTAYSLSLKNTPAENEIADWETYTEEEYGYAFKHPGDWSTFGHDSTGIITVIAPKGDLQKEIDIIVRNNSEELPLEEWLDEPIGSPYETRKGEINQVLGGINTNSGNMGLSYTNQKITVNGIEGIELILNRNDNPYKRSIIISKDKKVYVFSSVPEEGSDEDVIFDKMLSTFRFIEN